MEFTAQQIAALVGGTVEGDPNATVATFAKIEEGHKGAISFLSNPKYTHFIYTTQSSVVLVRRDFVAEQPIEATLIRVDDPYSTLARLLGIAAEHITPKHVGVEQPSFIAEGVTIPDDAYVGAFAYIGKGARIGKNAKIFPHTYIGENVVIGENTTLYAGVKVYYNCRIGNRCIIHAGAVVGSDGFGFAPVNGVYNKIPQLGNVVIDDDVEIGANTTIDRSVMGSTHIARGVKLDNLIQVAHNVSIGENTVMAAQVGIAGSTHIGSQCVVGGQVGFAGHLTIDDNVTIGAQAGVTSNLKAGSRVIGSPAINGSDFARQVVYVKKLGELNATVRDIQKQLKSND